MARRLTTFSKFLITLVILTILFFGGRYVMDNTAFGQDLKEQAEQAANEAKGETTSSSGSATTSSGSSSKSSKASGGDKNAETLRVQLVSWGGYAPGLYFNEGAQANMRSRFLKEYGFNVEFVLENDLINALNAWIADEYDIVVQTADAFPLYTAPADINAYKPKAFIQVDWSRGGDAIIVKRGINSVNDLKGKKIALAVPAPAQTLLSYSLKAAGLSYDDVNVIKTSDNIKAAELFRSDDVDAAVVWSPDDILATRDVPGSKILLTTVDQSHIIGDIMFAKEDVINEKKEMFNGFYEGWMKGVAELRNSANRSKAAKYLAEFNGIGVEDAQGMMETVYWTGHEDNLNFFGLNRDYRGQKGQDLYSTMAEEFVKMGDVANVAPSWRNVAYTGAALAANLTGSEYSAEGAKKFKAPTPSEISKAPVASKPVSINFSTGASTLTENAKTIIDLQFAETAKSFANMKVRIEGNTDSDGSRDLNMKLSEKRAQAVASYLQDQYGMDRNRFIVVGNGPDRPVAGCEQNQNASCKAKNRRTDFQLISSN